MTDVLSTLAKLPDMCAARSLTDGSPILIRRGVMGFYFAPPALNPDDFNSRRGITAEQVEAMEIGSMFGWEVPGVEDALAGR